MGLRPTRRQISEDHGLQYAPAAWRRQFWLRYNSRPRRAPETLGGLLGHVLSPEALADARRLSAIRAAWEVVLPDGFRERTHVAALRGGRLTIHVDSAATKFALSRQTGDALRTALNDALTDGRIDRIEFRVAGRTVHNETRTE